MFNMKPDNDRNPFNAAQDSNGGEAAPRRAATAPFAPVVTAASGASVFGSDLIILGDRITIVSQSKLLIEGRIRGDVHAREVVINKEGSVTGEIWAEQIDVLGEVRGSLIAVTLRLHDSAKVNGDVMHQKLSIAEGAEFDGEVQLIKDPRELVPILDADALARGRGHAETKHQLI
jgi:cytoskeletal protein CcmA (bactofilin family)